MSQWQDGKVKWFDKASGEGMIEDNDGKSYYVHYSTIVPTPKRTATITKESVLRNLEAGEEVKFQVYENLYSKRVEKVRQAYTKS